MSIPVNIQLLSGKVLTFQVFPLCKLENLCLEIMKILNIERSQIILFKEEDEVNYNDLVESEVIYRLLINELVVQMNFDRTIRLIHNYQELPKKALLEVSLEENSYRYMYNELLYVSNISDNFEFDDDYFEKTKNEEKLKKIFEKYEIDLEDSFDFRNLDEKLKIALINAYLYECLCISLKIEKYIFTPLEIYN